jgi:hypothetical protein
MLVRTASTVLTLLILSVAASPAAADVTVRLKNSGKGAMGAAMGGESTQQIKGAKMRTDQTIGSDPTSSIVDAGEQKMIVLNHKKREAEAHDMAKLSQEMAAATGEIKTSLTPTSRTRQIAGATCTDHDVRMEIPMQMGQDVMTMVMSGVVCLAQGAPGAADYAAFYEAAAENGLFFGDPRAAKAQPGQAKGMTALYRDMASRGVPYATELQMKVEGTGMMASMMNKMGGMTMTSEVLSISTDAIPDAQFEVPAGYKVRNR